MKKRRAPFVFIAVAAVGAIAGCPTVNPPYDCRDYDDCGDAGSEVSNDAGADDAGVDEDAGTPADDGGSLAG